MKKSPALYIVGPPLSNHQGDTARMMNRFMPVLTGPPENFIVSVLPTPYRQENGQRLR